MDKRGLALQAPIAFVCPLSCPHSWHSLTCLIVPEDKSYNPRSLSHKRDFTDTLPARSQQVSSEVCLPLLDSLILQLDMAPFHIQTISVGSAQFYLILSYMCDRDSGIP